MGEIIWCLAEGLQFVGNMDYGVMIIIGFVKSKFMMVKAYSRELPYRRGKKKKEITSTRKFMLIPVGLDVSCPVVVVCAQSNFACVVKTSLV